MLPITVYRKKLTQLICTFFSLSSSSTWATQAVEEVVVHANMLANSPLEMSTPAVLLGKNQLNFLAANSLGATLSSLPGITATSFGNGASRPIIRGLDGPRVRVLNDGLGMLDASDVSPDHAVSTEPLLAKGIEVLKGPATLLYGGGAIGGVVNILDNKIPTSAPENGYNGVAEARRDTVDDTETSLLSATVGNEKFAFHAEGLTRDGDDYSIPDYNVTDPANTPSNEVSKGREPNSFNNTHNYSLGGSLLQDDGYVGIAYSRQISKYGLPSEPQEAPFIDLDNKRFDVRGEHSFEKSVVEKVRLRFADADYQHKEIAGEEVATTFKNKAQEARLETVIAPIAGWHGVIGAQGLHRDFSALGEEAYVPRTDTHNYGVFVLEEYELNDWRFEFGARHEWQDISVKESADMDSDLNANSLSSGAVWEFVEGWSLHGSLSRSQRLPTPEELYADGPHAATNTFEIGDDNLGKETSTNIELSLHKTSGDLTSALTIYQNKIEDFIYAASTGNTVDEDGNVAADGFQEVIYTPTDSTFKGIEAELTYVFTEQFSAGLFGDSVRAKLDSGGDLPRIPAQRIGTNMNYNIALGKGQKIRSQLTFAHVDEQKHLAAFEDASNSYNNLNLGINYSLPVSNTMTAELFVNGNNLTNDTQRPNTSFIKESVPLPGRNLTLGARLFF